MKSISVVIPIYKNTEKFLSFFKHNYSFLKGCEIILVDDASSENLSDKIKKEKYEVRVIVHEKNEGFSKTVNDGVLHAHGEYLMLLNSDVKLKNIDFKNLIPKFELDPLLFAVSFKQKERDGSFVGRNRIFFNKGLFIHQKGKIETGINAWAEGGAALLRRKMFNDLGGFDLLYSPFYWEDIDLSYRAYKRGYNVLFDENIEVEHHHETTIKTFFQERFIKQTAYMHQFICTWKNITDTNLLMQHLVFLPYYLFKFTLKGDWAFIAGFFQACNHLGKILSERKKEKLHQIKTDREVFNLFLAK